jgi:hypothetical protein
MQRHHQPRVWRGAITAAVCGAVIGPLLAGLAGTAHAGDPALGAWTLSAAAHGQELVLAGQIDGTVPDAATTFETGGVSYGRAAIAWPGALAANLGDLIVVASGGQLPPSMEATVHLLNDPVRAEARSPSGPETASYDQVPGVVMQATASATGSTATSSVPKVDTPGVSTVGSSSSTTATRFDGAKVVAVAESKTGSISIAAGLVKIESVTSVAHAGSDGATGTGDGSTTVTGVTVAGQPATIDENGLRIGDQGGTTNEAVNQITQDQLSKAGIGVVMTKPVVDIRGRSATVGAGVLMITLGSGSQGIAVLFGGASAAATASPPFETSPTGTGVGTVAPIDKAPSVAAPSRLPGAAPATSSPTPPSQPKPVTDAAPAAAAIAFLGEANPVWLAALGAIVAMFVARALGQWGLGLFASGPICETGEET